MDGGRDEVIERLDRLEGKVDRLLEVVSEIVGAASGITEAVREGGLVGLMQALARGR